MILRTNKKKWNGQSFPAPFAVLLVVLSAVALGYLWLGSRCEALGKDIKNLETEQVSLEQAHRAAHCKWDQITSAVHMDRALRRHGIVLLWPDNSQIIRIDESQAFDNLVVERGKEAMADNRRVKGLL